MATSEQATVYRGGGRRYFTLKAACRAEARAKLKTRCECDYCDHPEMQSAGMEYLLCRLHEPHRNEKIVRRLSRLYMQAYKQSKG